MKPVSSACTHVHTYMGGGGYYFFHKRSFIPPGALKDGLQSVCTCLGGDGWVDGGVKRP